MRMFKRRADNQPNDSDGTVTTDGRRGYPPAAAADGRAAYATGTDPNATAERTWHRGPARAVLTLLGAGVAGLLAWLTTKIGDTSTSGYWEVYGILAGAGLVMALSQLLGGWTKWGRPSFSPTVFLLAFIPTLVAIGWIVVFHQPHGNTFRSHVVNWSGDLGISGFVKSMGGDLLTMLSFGLGLVFGFCFDTAGARRPTATPQQPMLQRTRRDTDADQPIARDGSARQRVPS